MSAIELIPDGGTPSTNATPVYWGSQTAGIDALNSTVDAWLTRFGTVSYTALGLARVAVAAFIADRMTKRPERTLTRQLTVVAHVPSPDALAPAVPDLVALLSWVTGDDWAIELLADRGTRPSATAATPVASVALLSGGLDSFAGAVLCADPAARAFLSHSDMGVTSASQRLVGEWFARHDIALDTTYVWLLPPNRTGVESTRRSRAALFALLAVALADARQASAVIVAENGFTSLNPPLGANRGGVWTTRSTHPHTFQLVRSAIASAGLDTDVENPYALCTKGELVAQAAAAGLSAKDAAVSHSCARTSQRFVGGSPSDHCGLCFACLVRRGAMLAAFGADPTSYLVDTLPTEQRNQLIQVRRQDITAVSYAVARAPTMRDLLPMGPFDGMNVDDALDLWCRALKELDRVPLP